MIDFDVSSLAATVNDAMTRVWIKHISLCAMLSRKIAISPTNENTAPITKGHANHQNPD